METQERAVCWEALEIQEHKVHEDRGERWGLKALMVRPARLGPKALWGFKEFRANLALQACKGHLASRARPERQAFLGPWAFQVRGPQVPKEEARRKRQVISEEYKETVAKQARQGRTVRRVLLVRGVRRVRQANKESEGQLEHPILVLPAWMESWEV